MREIYNEDYNPENQSKSSTKMKKQPSKDQQSRFANLMLDSDSKEECFASTKGRLEVFWNGHQEFQAPICRLETLMLPVKANEQSQITTLNC